jgi:hypothetical protein
MKRLASRWTWWHMLIEQRIPTEPERFAAVLGERPRVRIVLEASTDSERVTRCLEGLGHEVIVADPSRGTPAPWRTPACSAPTARRIGCPMPSRMCKAA